MSFIANDVQDLLNTVWDTAAQSAFFLEPLLAYGDIISEAFAADSGHRRCLKQSAAHCWSSLHRISETWMRMTASYRLLVSGQTCTPLDASDFALDK